MRTFILVATVTAVALFFSLYFKQKRFQWAVEEAVTRQMEHYPKSTLKDIYKNFFQDVFGPGHIISDTTAAGNYLRREMASYTHISGEIAEPLGWENNYLRVNLSVIKNGWVPYDVYFEAFVSSVNDIKPIPVPQWQNIWNKAEAIIRKMNLNLPGYEADKQEIEERLNQGDYVGHHSKAYEEAYDPHYRIISRERYEKDILPLLKQAQVID